MADDDEQPMAMLLDPNSFVAKMIASDGPKDFLYCDHDMAVNMPCVACAAEEARNRRIASGNDLGAGRFAQEKPCCERIGNGSWCNLDLNHKSDHSGAPPVYGPVRDPNKKFYTPPIVVVGGFVVSPGIGAWRDDPGRRVALEDGGYVSPEEPK